MAVSFFWGIRANSSTMVNVGTEDYSDGDTIAGAFGSPTKSADGFEGSWCGIAPINTQGGYGFSPASLVGLTPGTEDFTNAQFASAWSFYCEGTLTGSAATSQFGFRVGIDGTNELMTGLDENEKLCIHGEKASSTPSVRRASMTSALSTGQWYGCVFRVDIPNDRIALSLYTHDGTFGSTATHVETIEDTYASWMDHLPAYVPNNSTGVHWVWAGGTHVTSRIRFKNLFLAYGADAYTELLENNLTIDRYVDYSAVTGTIVVPNPAGMSV